MKIYTLLLSLVLTCGLKINAQTFVSVYTTKGNFELEIYDNIVPITGGNFIKLVKEKYYDGVIFHRVIKGFMIQGGDPTGTGTGGPGYSIDDEFDASLSNLKATISMANAGPNTGGSQFFINLVNNTFLDYNKAPLSSKHPVFGVVTENFSVIEIIGGVKTNASDRPNPEVRIDSMRVGKLEDLTIPEEYSLEVGLYPNPVIQSSKIIFTTTQNKTVTIKIIDIVGRLFTEKNIDLEKGETVKTFSSLSSKTLQSGFYTLHIDDHTNKPIKQINFILK